MKPIFERTTGSTVRVAFTDCECHSYSRPYCYACVEAVEYFEQDPVFSNITVKPTWFARRQKTHNTPADVRFLSGIPERKPFYPKKRFKSWQRPRNY